MDENLTQLTELFDIAQEFKTNIDRSFWGTLIPNTLGIAATLFLHWGYTAAVLLNASLWVPQLAYVMHPLYKYQNQEARSSNPDG